MARRDYSNWTLKDFQDYYNENLVGISRFGVFKENNSFYHVVRNSGFIDKIFPKDKRGEIKRKNKELDSYSLKDFQEYYKKHYKEMSRSEVCKEDPGFYRKIMENKFFDKVLPEKKSGRQSEFSDFSLQDYQEYYYKNHKGKGRKEVHIEDNRFYNNVRKTGLLEEVFLEDKRGKNVRRNKELNLYSLKDFQDYYKKHYKEMSRSEVCKEDQGFYRAIMKRKLSEMVFPEKKSGRNGKFSDFSMEELHKYYEENFKQLKETPKGSEIFVYKEFRQKGMDIEKILKEYYGSFYGEVRRRGLNMQIFKLNKKSLELNVN